LISTYILVIVVPVLTALIITFGPDPVFRVSKYLSPGVVGLNEVRDQVALASWWVLVAAAGLFVHRSFSTHSENLVDNKSSSRLWLVLTSVSASLFFAGLVLQLDTKETDNWNRVDFSVVTISVLILVAVNAFPRLRREIQIALQAFSAVVLATCLASIFQTPATIRDPSHFIFTSNELLAPSAGLYPLSNFVATYNNLLGFPIVPFVRMFPGQAMSILVGYLVSLQVFCLCVPALASRIVGLWKLAIPMTLIPVVLVTSANVNGHAQHTWFQSLPMRSAVPSLLLIVLVWVVSRPNGLGKLASMSLGALAAVSVVNNPDFGAPAAVAAVVAMALCLSTLRHRVRTLMLAALGGVTSLIFLWVAYSLFGQTLNFQFFFQFTRMVSSAGYMKEAMPIGGIPIVMVTGFCLGTVLGVYAVGRAHRVNDRKVLASATFLLFSSLWGLLSYIYYAGRSYSITAIGGHSYQLGLVISGVVMYLVLDSTHLRDQTKRVGTPGYVLPVIAVAFIAFITSAYLSVPSPLSNVSSFRNRGSQFILQQHLVREFQVLRERGILSDKPEDIGLLLPISNALQQSGVGRSILITMHPQFTELMPEIAKLQCEAVVASDSTLIVEAKEFFGFDGARFSILDLPPCKDILRNTVKLEYDGVIFRLLRRSDSDAVSP